jgi:hypothetical protein
LDYNSIIIPYWVGPGSSVGIAIGYGLNSPGSNPGWGAIFRTLSDRPWGTMGTRSFPGVKRLGRGANHPPPSSAEVTKGQSYTSIHPLGQLRPVTGLLYLYLYWVYARTTQINRNYVCVDIMQRHFNALLIIL